MQPHRPGGPLRGNPQNEKAPQVGAEDQDRLDISTARYVQEEREIGGSHHGQQKSQPQGPRLRHSHALDVHQSRRKKPRPRAKEGTRKSEAYPAAKERRKVGQATEKENERVTRNSDHVPKNRSNRFLVIRCTRSSGPGGGPPWAEGRRYPGGSLRPSDHQIVAALNTRLPFGPG